MRGKEKTREGREKKAKRNKGNVEKRERKRVNAEKGTTEVTAT